jgi:hypothetical protein
MENDASNNDLIVACIFVTAVKFLPSRYLVTITGSLASRCLATTGVYIDTQNDGRGL